MSGPLTENINVKDRPYSKVWLIICDEYTLKGSSGKVNIANAMSRTSTEIIDAKIRTSSKVNITTCLV